AGIVCVRLQSGEFAVKVSAANRKAVYRNVVPKQFLDDRFIAVFIVLCILPVGDEKDNLAPVTPAVRQKARSLIDCVIQSLICAVAYCFRGTCNGGSPGNVLPVDGRSGGEWLARGSHVRRGVESRAPQLRDQLVLVLRKALPRMKIRVEAADERFVRSS